MAYLGLVFSMFEILWFSPTLEFSLMSQKERKKERFLGRRRKLWRMTPLYDFFFSFFFMYFLDVCVLGQELKYFQR